MNRRELFKGFGALVVVAPVIAQLPPTPAAAAPKFIPPAPALSPWVDEEGVCRVLVNDLPSGRLIDWAARAFFRGEELQVTSLAESIDYDYIDAGFVGGPRRRLPSVESREITIGAWQQGVQLDLEGPVLDVVHRRDVTEARVWVRNWRRTVSF